MPIILQNYKSVACTQFCHSHVENGFKMNRVLIKALSPISVWSVKVSMNLYLHIVNFEIERYITIMVPMLSIK